MDEIFPSDPNCSPQRRRERREESKKLNLSALCASAVNYYFR